jgi:hypothetical protein
MLGLESISYATHVTFTGETSFAESGTIAFGSEGDALRISTLRDGFLGPSPDPARLHGAVLWKIDRGEGRLAGASGLITSNFLLSPQTGDVSEQQSAVIFVAL